MLGSPAELEAKCFFKTYLLFTCWRIPNKRASSNSQRLRREPKFEIILYTVIPFVMKENKISEVKVFYRKTVTPLLVVDSNSVYNIFLSSWNSSTIEFQEEFKILLLDRNNHVLGIYTASKGGVNSTIVDPKIIFSVALKCHASSLILAHNHPSGNLKPSEPDKKLTEKLINAGKLLEIEILDHLILVKDNYFSFADEGIIRGIL